MKYISLLRGINVSGHKKVKMADLKAMYEALEFTDVITYIQSGNVVFESANKNANSLQEKIEIGIKKQFTFDVPVTVKTKRQWQKLVDRYPFTDINPIEEGTKVVVTLLSEQPKTKTLASALNEYIKAPERLLIDGDVIYLYCPNGYGKTKFSNTFIEKKLGLRATTRNWKTVSKLLEIS